MFEQMFSVPPGCICRTDHSSRWEVMVLSVLVGTLDHNSTQAKEQQAGTPYTRISTVAKPFASSIHVHLKTTCSHLSAHGSMIQLFLQ